MKLLSLREEVIEYGKKLITSNLTKGTGGNLSICDRESGLMAISPSGIDYFCIKPEQVVLIDIQTGKIVEGDAVPSSECDMHRIFYKYRTDINAVIHTHSTFAATLSTLGEDLPAIDYLVALGGGNDVKCAPYATYGSVALAKSAFEYMKDRKAVILANHGLVAGGSNLGEAFFILEEIEFCCELYIRAKSVGTPTVLEEDEMERMVERFKNYGKRVEEHDEI